MWAHQALAWLERREDGFVLGHWRCAAIFVGPSTIRRVEGLGTGWGSLLWSWRKKPPHRVAGFGYAANRSCVFSCSAAAMFFAACSK